MSATNLDTVNEQVQKFWSPLFMNELRAALLIGALVNKDYQGEIKEGGDTVYVSQINAPNGENRSTSADGDSFQTEQLSTTRIAVTADKRAIAAYEFSDLSQLQSQLGAKQSEIRDALVYAVSKKINDYLYSLVAPSSSAPDHIINSVTDFNASQVSDARKRGAVAKWDKRKPWWILCDPSYYSDLLNAQTLTSKDYVDGEAPVVGGQIANQRFGFNILEDNGLAVDQAVIFHPDFLHMVMQKAVQIKVSDLHANKKFGYVISADVIYGAKLGINGNKKHQLVVADASATSVVIA